ncbi:MAG: phosphoribosyltransferase [Flavobacteriales bacterium CG_4_10_14_0_2_um_filter_32_8]|nr:MAG: phosphoribosyltransferase [Flavobacteriales bacterium CG_4_10_14_0_2_um_filter_32_8]PJB15489.1 MAG: phosphoribosyltransferase [Flavobacteriales bacterium CG_4_9_14_3_um_filter_32_8]
MSENKTLILNSQQIHQKINRISYQIYEDNYTEDEIIVVGIANKGYLLATKIVKQLNKIASCKITLAKLTINKNNPIENNGQLDISSEQLNDKVVILVDDVLNTGKALIYGVKYLLDFPIKKISTAVLVDRNHKKYPIGTHYVGLSLSTTLQNHISLEFNKSEITAFLN